MLSVLSIMKCLRLLVTLRGLESVLSRWLSLSPECGWTTSRRRARLEQVSCQRPKKVHTDCTRGYRMDILHSSGPVFSQPPIRSFYLVKYTARSDVPQPVAHIYAFDSCMTYRLQQCSTNDAIAHVQQKVVRCPNER
ncbi:hypothetical protein C8Q78DRAFT_132543 [Trametes maxima]|nr:hypothetical protein C8Q78DRAFT_132543 [Trametes maxima]